MPRNTSVMNASFSESISIDKDPSGKRKKLSVQNVLPNQNIAFGSPNGSKSNVAEVGDLAVFSPNSKLESTVEELMLENELEDSDDVSISAGGVE